MEKEIRRFRCKQCSQSANVCRSCDRGQVYCSDECRAEARKEQNRRAGEKYRRSAEAREKARLRQRRCRARRSVTQHPATSAASVSIPNTKRGRVDRNPHRDCDFCGGQTRTPREWLSVAGEELLGRLARQARGLLPEWPAVGVLMPNTEDLAQTAITSFLLSPNPEYKTATTFDRMSGILFGFLQNHASNERRKFANQSAVWKSVNRTVGR